MPDVIKRQREARRKIIRQRTKLPRDKRQSVEEISAFARTAAQQNKSAFVRSRREPYEKIMGWLLPRAHVTQEFTEYRETAPRTIGVSARIDRRHSPEEP